jgi:glycerol-1-phosphate dehydrogenase [NAD(P)+]
MDEKTVRSVNEAFRDSWKEIRQRVLDRLLPYARLKEMLKTAACPLRPEVIGLKRDYTIATARRAQMIRNRYGVLDLAWDTGCFGAILAKMEESDIYLK